MLGTAQSVAQISATPLLPLYQEAAELERGVLMLRENNLTIDEIAQALGVSKTTVSRAISGKGRVSKETRARVMAYLQEAGARPRTYHVPEQTHNLALVIPSHFIQLDLPFLRKCMGGICRMAAQRGYDVLLCFADSQNTEQLERQLAAGKVDGVILSRTLKQDPCMDLLKQYRTPFVVLGHHDDPAVLQVDNNQAAAAMELTRLLLQLGMRRIAYMGGSLNYTVNADRLAGYRAALAEARIPFDSELAYSDVESDEKRVDDLEAALEKKPECLLCCDDNMAYAVMTDLRKRGIRVPEDIRLASLYDSELLAGTQPGITAVQFDAAALGTAACRLLLDSMAGKMVMPRIVHGHQVILRGSTK